MSGTIDHLAGQFEAVAFLDRTGEEAADAVRLPGGGDGEFVDCGALLPAQELQDLGGLLVGVSLGGLLVGLRGRLRLCGGFGCGGFLGGFGMVVIS